MNHNNIGTRSCEAPGAPTMSLASDLVCCFCNPQDITFYTMTTQWVGRDMIRDTSACAVTGLVGIFPDKVISR